MNAINIILQGNVYFAQFSGPHAAEIEELFGTTLLPTGHMHLMPVSDVVDAIQRNNIGCIVRVSE